MFAKPCAASNSRFLRESQQLAQRSGLTIDTVRFYEKRGLLDHNHFQRGENGYRIYNENTVERLVMIKHAQSAGFTLIEIRDLFVLWDRDQLNDDRIVVYLHKKRRYIVEKIKELEHVEHYITEKLESYKIDITEIEVPDVESGLAG